MDYGLQLYSVRDITESDFEGALRSVVEMGYSMVETAGFFGHSGKEVGDWLKKYGLKCCSTHTGLSDLENDFEGTIERHKAIGCENIIIPSARFKTKEELDYTIARINKFQPMVEAEGMKLHYHNHSKEFWKNLDGQIAHDELAERTNILFQLDTFWVHNAGLDPVALMEKYRGRLSVIHLKDGIAQDLNDPSSKPVGKSLGLGNAPVAEVRKKAIEMGVTIVVESEDLYPTGIEEVKRCIDYLRTLD